MTRRIVSAFLLGASVTVGVAAPARAATLIVFGDDPTKPTCTSAGTGETGPSVAERLTLRVSTPVGAPDLDEWIYAECDPTGVVEPPITSSPGWSGMGAIGGVGGGWLYDPRAIGSASTALLATLPDDVFDGAIDDPATAPDEPPVDVPDDPGAPANPTAPSAGPPTGGMIDGAAEVVPQVDQILLSEIFSGPAAFYYAPEVPDATTDLHEDELNASPVPEPGSLLLLGFGFTLAEALRRAMRRPRGARS